MREAEGLALSVVIGVPTSKGTAWMELDTGNDDPVVVVSKYIAPLLGVDPASHSPHPIEVALGPGMVLKGDAEDCGGPGDGRQYRNQVSQGVEHHARLETWAGLVCTGETLTGVAAPDCRTHRKCRQQVGIK